MYILYCSMFSFFPSCYWLTLGHMLWIGVKMKQGATGISRLKHAKSDLKIKAWVAFFNWELRRMSAYTWDKRPGLSIGFSSLSLSCSCLTCIRFAWFECIHTSKERERERERERQVAWRKMKIIRITRAFTGCLSWCAYERERERQWEWERERERERERSVFCSRHQILPFDLSPSLSLLLMDSYGFVEKRCMRDALTVW